MTTWISWTSATLALVLGMGCATGIADEAPSSRDDVREPQAASAAGPAGEAGFIEVPPQREGRSVFVGRMFYVYRPADEDPANKPLIVLFNGGPHFATTSGLVAFGTGPYTLDRRAPAGTAPVANPKSLTRFANLLYIDERAMGFSYGIGAPQPSCVFDPIDDAADYLHVLLTFLAQHPELARAKLAIVGESYGGLRATTMAHLFLRYAEKDARGVGLTDRIAAYASATFGTAHTEVLPPAKMAERLLGLVLIQPYVLGALQLETQRAAIRDDPELGKALRLEAAADDVREAPGYLENELLPRVYGALADREQSRLLFGTHVDAVRGIAPSDRVGAFRFESVIGSAALNDTFTQRLGALAPTDRYYDVAARACSFVLDEGTTDRGRFFGAARWVPMLVTSARYDATIHSPTILSLLDSAGARVERDAAPRAGAPRPGWFSFAVPAGDGASQRRVTVRYPSYEAGHAITVTNGGELADDIGAFVQ